MPRALVTGGAGFIGSHLCESLLHDGWDVVALDNFDDFYDAGIKRANIAAIRGCPRFTLAAGDIRSERDVREALLGAPDFVIHLAARAGVRPSIKDPLLYEEVNVRGTIMLLEQSRRIDGCRFIFASSSSVYGNADHAPFCEDDPAGSPISPYGASKRSGELMCHAYHQLYGMPITCLRFFTVYGPRQRPDLAIHTFATRIERGEPINIFGDGTMERDFTFIDDIILGVRLAMRRCDGFRIYNVGESRPVSVNELVAALEAALGKPARIKRVPAPIGDVRRTWADLTRARNELGYQPRTELNAGLREFVRWLRNANDKTPARAARNDDFDQDHDRRTQHAASAGVGSAGRRESGITSG